METIAQDASMWTQYVRGMALYIAHTDIRLGQRIYGGRSQIYRATIYTRRQRFAVKCLPMATAQSRLLALNEMQRWMSFRHPNILPLVGVSNIPDDNGVLELALISEFATFTSLSSLMLYRAAPEGVVLRLARDIASALHYIHSQRIIYGDLHSRNVVVNSDLQALLIDFGSCTDNEFGTRRSGTRGYEAPEMIRPAIRGVFGYNCRADIWPLGIILCELLGVNMEWRNPLHDDPQYVQRLLNGAGPFLSDAISPETRALICRCLTIRPRDRPSAQFVADHASKCLQQLTSTSPNYIMARQQSLRHDRVPLVEPELTTTNKLTRNAFLVAKHAGCFKSVYPVTCDFEVSEVLVSSGSSRTDWSGHDGTFPVPDCIDWTIPEVVAEDEPELVEVQLEVERRAVKEVGDDQAEITVTATAVAEQIGKAIIEEVAQTSQRSDRGRRQIWDTYSVTAIWVLIALLLIMDSVIPDILVHHDDIGGHDLA